MKWEEDFHGAMKNFMREGRRSSPAGVEAHIQALKQAINQINVRTKSDKHNIDIAKLHLNHIKRMCRKLKRDLEESRLDESLSSENFSLDSPQEVLQLLGLSDSNASEEQIAAASLISLIGRDVFEGKVAFITPKEALRQRNTEIFETLQDFSKELDVTIPVEAIFLVSGDKNTVARAKKMRGSDYNEFSQTWDKFMAVVMDNAVSSNPLNSEKFTMATFSSEYIEENMKDLVKYLWQAGGLADMGAALAH